jgi:hypothetical protein
MKYFSKQTITVIVLLMLPALALICMNWNASSIYITGLFALSALVALLLGQYVYRRNNWLDLALDAGIAVATAVIIFRLYPGEFYDDAGFVLRYMENFEKGYFYAFNPGDGPVFGISSPFQGLVNGAICSTGVWLPEQALRRTAFIGLTTLTFLLIRILRKTSDKSNDFLLYAGLVLISSKMFLAVMKAGLETPMHIAVVLAAFWSYYHGRTRLMWAMLALAVISKLDAVPLVLVIGLAWLAGNYRALLPFGFRNKQLLNILFFAVLPVGIWVAVATHFFGSPLPQSAFAKIHYHSHPDDYWFPFFVRYAKDDFYKYLLLAAALLSAVLFITALVRRTISDLRLLLPGVAFTGTMVLYYFYNPGERMMWYYAMPDLLLLLQLVLSLRYVLNMIEDWRIRSGVTYVTGLAMFVFIFPDVYGGKYWLNEYLNTVEYERNEIGKYIATRVPEHDTVMVWHGLPGRYTKGYVLDMSGLNSKLVTEYKRDMKAITEKFRPNYTVNHRFSDYCDVITFPPYSLDTIFYDITAYGNPSWQIYKRVGGEAKHEFPLMIGQPNVWSGEFTYVSNVARVKGNDVQVAGHDDNVPIVSFACGIEKEETASDLIFERVNGDTVLETIEVHVWPIGREKETDARRVQGFRWNFKTPVIPKQEVVVRVRRKNGGSPLTVVDPAYIHTY